MGVLALAMGLVRAPLALIPVTVVVDQAAEAVNGPATPLPFI